MCPIGFSGYGIVLLNNLLRFMILQKIRHAIQLSEYNSKNDSLFEKFVIHFGLFCGLSKTLSSRLSLYFSQIREVYLFFEN
jgi:hypothetical protein